MPLARLMGKTVLASVSESELQQLRSLENSFLEQIPQHVRNSDSLDEFCRRQRHQFELCTELCVVAPGDVLRARLAAVAAEIGKLRCKDCRGCVATGNGPCSGDLNDNANVAGGAACLQEVFEAFDFIKKLVETHLSEVIENGETRSLEIRLQTMFNAGQEHVSGSCSHDAGRVSDVVGIMLPRSGCFTFPTLTQLPYALAHEVVCHAAQGIEVDGERESGGEYCPWTEGWMDCLAAEILTDALLANSVDVPEWIRGEASAFVHATDNAHKRRLQAPSKEFEFLYLQRENAHLAWRNFLVAAVNSGMDEDDAIELRRNVCLTYNAMTRPAVERENVGARLTLYFLLRRGDTAAIEAFRRFRNSRHVRNFCSEISILSRNVGLTPFAA